MRLMKQLLVGIIVLTPLIFSAMVPLAPHPVQLSDARKAGFQAEMINDPITESSALRTELSFTPWQGEKWQRLGRLDLNLKRYKDAVEAFEHAQSSGQLTIEGKLWMADALISNDQFEKAREMLREFSSLDDVDPFVFLQAALMQRSLNDTYGALATLLRGYEVDPLNGEINYQTGLQLSAVEPDKALPFLERAAQMIPGKKDLCAVLETTIEGSAVLGESAERYITIGQVLSTHNEWDVAQNTFQHAVDLDEQNGVAWALLAEAVQQNHQDGQKFITKAQQLAPDAELVNGLSALYYRRQGKSELALIYLQKALDENPDALVWEIEMGNTYSSMGDLSSAMEHYQAAAKIDPQSWTVWRVLASFCVTYNYQVETIGLPAVREALKLYEGSPALMDLLGTALMLTNDLDEAEYYFLAADRIDPHQTPILIHLGQLYISKGDKEKGIEYLRQAIEYARDERLLEMAKRLLSENEIED